MIPEMNFPDLKTLLLYSNPIQLMLTYDWKQKQTHSKDIRTGLQVEVQQQ